MSTLDFSPLLSSFSTLTLPSPRTGAYIATVPTTQPKTLILRDAQSLKITHAFKGEAKIQGVVWANTEDLIATWAGSEITIWGLDAQNWKATIQEGTAGITRVIFAESGRHIITFTDFAIRVNIWSLENGECRIIRSPRYSDGRGCTFRFDGAYFAILTREDCKDSISIYSTEDWLSVKTFPIDTLDCHDIVWSPCGAFIAAWDSLDGYVGIYRPDGRKKEFRSDMGGLGAKHVKWSPTSQFLAVVGWDGKTRILNNYTWTALTTIYLPTVIQDNTVSIFSEIGHKTTQQQPADLVMTMEQIKMFPHGTVPKEAKAIDQSKPSQANLLFEWNCDGSLFALREADSQSQNVYIYSIHTLSLTSVMKFAAPVKAIVWNPGVPGRCLFSFSVINMSHAKESLGFGIWQGAYNGLNETAVDDPNWDKKCWDVQVCESIKIPTVPFRAQSVTWNPDGASIIVTDKERMTVGFLVD